MSNRNNNPFRSALTPNPTGTSVSSAPSYHSTLPNSHTLLAPIPAGGSASAPPSYRTSSEQDPHSDDEESPEALPELTPRISQSRTPPALPPRDTLQNQSALLRPRQPTPPAGPSPVDDLLPPDAVLPESAPPAYSVTPDVGSGETVVEQGPRRPFQRAPEPFLQLPVPAPQQRPPPVRNPTPTPPQRPHLPERPLSQMSDFAREFYAAGTTPPSTTAAGQEQDHQSPPYQPRYAPPPGPPPPRRPRAASTSSGAGSTAPPTSNGRPTTTPTPGHPLLRNGQTLVYPEGYVCPKCVSPVLSRSAHPLTCPLAAHVLLARVRHQGRNTGYKNFDPYHPCRKCWDRFGKPFTSVLASSPWGNQGGSATSSSQSERGRSFQRPLPAFKPPQERLGLPSMPGSYPQTPAVPLPPGAVPPPGSTVVMPGDARIGGRQCWRCGGRGLTPFLIFDELPCETCGGIGRLFN